MNNWHGPGYTNLTKKAQMLSQINHLLPRISGTHNITYYHYSRTVVTMT